MDEGEESLREQVVEGNVTQSLVTIFRPSSRNLVRVLAFNDMFDGPPSDVIEFTTPEETPGPVDYFDAIPLGSSALYLIWKRPLEPNGVLTGYNIYYREVNGTELGEIKARMPQITDPRETRAKLGGLKPKTKYLIYIGATTWKGEGEKKNIEIQTKEQTQNAPDEPHFVYSHLPNVDGKAVVRVTWIPTVDGHPGSHFFVQYRKKASPVWESTPPEVNEETILVTGLELGSLYEMRVVAVDGPFQTPSKVVEFEAGRLEKPKIKVPPENLEVTAGKTATFRCDAGADLSLQLKIVWLFNGQPINSDIDSRMVQASDNSLTITETVEEDSGVYTCVAKTELDQDEAAATLTVQDPPNPPKIEEVMCDGLTALVRWQPMGDHRAPILSYTIQFKTSFSPDEWEDAIVSIPAADTSFKVSMTPWANYTFRVIARHKIGPSKPSDHSNVCETPENVPFKNPDNVVGKGTEKDNLVISWTVMPMIEHNAPGFFYRVYWKREDIPQAQWENADINDGEQNTFIISNQPTFKPYRIKVEAHNSRGQAQSNAAEVVGYSGEDKPLEAPKTLKVVSVKDGRTAELLWDPVSPESVRGHFRGYKIQTWTMEEGEERLREQVVKGNVTKSLVTILRPSSRNLVRVLAFNDMYDGPPTDNLDFYTQEETPGPVAYFKAIPLGSSALHLTWEKPLEPNGVLTGYNIYYREVNGTELGEIKARMPQITDPRETRAKLGGLKPKTKYRIEIRATTWKGEGEKKNIEVQTKEQTQNAPDEPYFIWHRLPNVDGKAGVRVTWVTGEAYQQRSHFFVQYRKKDAPAWESTPPEVNEDTILVTGLELASLYEMRVVAVDGPFQTNSKIKEFATVGMDESW